METVIWRTKWKIRFSLAVHFCWQRHFWTFCFFLIPQNPTLTRLESLQQNIKILALGFFHGFCLGTILLFLKPLLLAYLVMLARSLNHGLHYEISWDILSWGNINHDQKDLVSFILSCGLQINCPSHPEKTTLSHTRKSFIPSLQVTGTMVLP